MKYFEYPVGIDSVGIRNDQAIKEAEETLPAPGVTDWYLVPFESTSVSCMVDCTAGGSGRIQTTNDTYENIKNGTAVSEDWPYGNVSSTSTLKCDGVKAVRAVCISGSVRVVFSSRVL